MDSCCKELELNAELVAYLNKAQAVEAIKEAEVHHTATMKEAKMCLCPTTNSQGMAC